MGRFKHLMVAVLAVVGLVIVVENVAWAQKVSVAVAAQEKSAARSTRPVGRSHSRAHVDSVLTSPRAAIVNPEQGRGWLLHYGTEHDGCARTDATIATMRAMCVSW